jgi:hypothetical protein
LAIGGDTELIPTRYAYSLYSLEANVVPTDLYYACLDGDWNADLDADWAEGYTFGENSSDNADLYPELLVGRIPVTTPAQVATVLAKMRAYCEPGPLDYQNKLLFMAEVLWPATYRPGDPILKNGADNIERIIDQCGLEDPRWSFTRLYETPQYYPGSLPLTRAASIAAMNSGYGVVTHIGHGFRYTMSLGDASLTNVNAMSLNNGLRPFVLNMLNCSSAAYDFPCLAEKFLLNPSGGAVAVIGTAREAYPDNIQLFQESWFQSLYRTGFTGAAEALNESRLQYVAQTYDDGAYRWSNFITVYLGDPEIDMWLQGPRTASVSYAPTMALGTRSFPVQVTSGGMPVAGAVVCLQKAGDFYATGRTNLAGLATLAVAAESPGQAALCVSGAGLLPQRGTVVVNATVNPALRVSGGASIQDSGAGTVGNGNGQPEAGETILLRFTVENHGTVLADGVTLQVWCTDPALLVSSSAIPVGNLGPGGSLVSSPVTATVSNNVLDQSHVRLDLVVRNNVGATWNDRVYVDLLQVAPRVQRVWVDDNQLGDGDGLAEANETYNLRVELKNYGFAVFEGATGQLTSMDPDVVLLNAVTTFGSIDHLATAPGSFRVKETNVAQPNRMTLLVREARGRTWTFAVESHRPDPPIGINGEPGIGPGTIRLTWGKSPSTDVAGYVIYRASSGYGPWVRASLDAVCTSTSFQDDGLAGGARYYYMAAAIDSVGNESSRTPSLNITTNPPQLTGWPQQLGLWSNSSPVVADLDGNGSMEIVVGASDRVYAWRWNGVEVRDGDNNPVTTGVFNSIAGNFMPGLAAGDLDLDGRDEIIGCTFDTRMVYVFQGDGSVRAGWPRPIVSTTHGIWATPALADLDMDGRLEIIVLGLDGRLYAWRANGTEMRDGDANPATNGVLFQVPGSAVWSRGAPAVGNLLPADATPEIVFGTENNLVYMLRADGSIAPGWPRTVGNHINAAPSVADIDGDGALDIAVPARDGVLYVFRRDGTNLTGWPRPLVQQWNALTPSVACADFDADGKLELVAASTVGSSEGSLYVFDSQGNVRSGWPVNVHTAGEASPIVGDLDSDGKPEIVYGGESGVLYGFRADGTLFPGFPIRVGSEVRATPTMSDADGDGHVDLVFSGWDQQVYVWRFSGLYVRRNSPWGAFKGNMWRNGLYDYRLPTSTESNAPPARSALHANVPNPFNPTTTLRFDVGGETARAVRLAIFDVRGRRVRTLVDRRMSPGRYTEVWDGHDEAGRALPSGVYFSRFEAGDLRATRKLVLVR